MLEIQPVHADPALLQRLHFFGRGELIVRRFSQLLLRIEAAVKQVNRQVLHVRTGRFFASITSHGGAVTRSGTELTGRIGSDLVYPPVHEFGAVIEPVRARALHFFVDGREVFTQRVTIPARPSFGPGIASERIWLLERLKADLLRGPTG